MANSNKFGRWEHQPSVDAFFASQQNPTVTQAAPAVLAADDNADVDLCKIYEQVARKPWNSENQNPRGFCVGFGNTKMARLALALAAYAGEIDFPGDCAIEPIYGGSRYEIGYQRYRSNIPFGGDGGVGAWAAEWMQTYGLLMCQPYGSIDLSNYSMERCDQYGRQGVPDVLEPEAKIHPLKDISLCEDATQVWRMIGQYHPVVHCSNQGYSMERNRDGTCDANDTWPHCAGWSGRFTLSNGEQVIRYDNSWNGRPDGHGYLGSPIVIQGKYGQIFLNGNQFLVPMEIVDRTCKRGKETYALSGPQGFTIRRPLLLI